jgi:hypothetical protein
MHPGSQRMYVRRRLRQRTCALKARRPSLTMQVVRTSLLIKAGSRASSVVLAIRVGVSVLDPATFRSKTHLGGTGWCAPSV